jgi:hypothetical protein
MKARRPSATAAPIAAVPLSVDERVEMLGARWELIAATIRVA